MSATYVSEFVPYWRRLIRESLRERQRRKCLRRVRETPVDPRAAHPLSTVASRLLPRPREGSAPPERDSPTEPSSRPAGLP
jgi:hypothetical protein